MSRRYRACSARCAEILDNLKDASQVEPAYLIYLHFYAAASMEMCTRPLPLTSPYRAALLQQARTHYDRANSLIQAAEDSVAAKTRSGSASSSRTPSLHSPSSSVSSSTSSCTSRGAWTAETSVHSPTNSIYSFDGEQPPPSPCRAPAAKRVKKVSFSLPPCAKELLDEEEQSRHSAFRFPEPLVRPDSPTLGFDDEYFAAGAGLRDLPAPPPPPRSALRPQPRVVTELLPLRPEDEGGDDGFFRVERSVHRYNETLARLRAQLAGHSLNLGVQLVLAADIGSSRPSSPMSPTFEKAGGDAVRAAERQARIERLRKNGWVRKRFDGRRYEDLAREVLAEL